MFTKVSEQRSAARRYALCKAAADPIYNTGGWAPPAVAKIPKNETPSYDPEFYNPHSGYFHNARTSIATDSIGYFPNGRMFAGATEAELAPYRLRAKLDPRYGNWFAAHNDALESLPINGRDAPLYYSLHKLPKERADLANAYHKEMYRLTNGVPPRASAIYTR